MRLGIGHDQLIMAEFGLIDFIRQRVVDRHPVELGIGDDAAVLAPSPQQTLVTTDMLMEGVDFNFPETSPALAGRKSLAVNLSDLAAMGGFATAAFLSVAFPRQRGEAFAREFVSGLLELADEFGVTLAGGDTNSWDQPLVASVTLLGWPWGPRPITRSGARPGDRIFVTGELGGSIYGHHLTFTPRIREAGQLVQLVDVHAMIDISDGLAADLHHILAASDVGAILQADALPLRAAAREPISGPAVSNAPTRSTAEQINQLPRPLRRALSDGEDFELLFTVAPQDADVLQRQWPLETPLHGIGEITADRSCWLELGEGERLPLPPLGWQHPLS